jgi:hypothetical protein
VQLAARYLVGRRSGGVCPGRHLAEAGEAVGGVHTLASGSERSARRSTCNIKKYSPGEERSKYKAPDSLSSIASPDPSRPKTVDMANALATPRRKRLSEIDGEIAGRGESWLYSCGS